MSTLDQIILTAEGMIRDRGYNGFSYREVADAIGIKSASIHYHFPTKGDLGEAVAMAYTEKFLQALGDPNAASPSPAKKIEAYIAACRYAIVEQDKMCLCGMLGAEVASLPVAVAQETKVFFDCNIDWLTKVYAHMTNVGSAGARRRAFGAIATVEGAMILARSLKDPGAFDLAVKQIARS